MVKAKEYSIAAAEVNKILRYTSDVDVNKIPIGLRTFLKDIEDPNYVADINPTISLEQQNISQKAQDILAMIYCYYWCSEEELAKLKQELRQSVQNTSQEIFGNASEETLFEDARKRRANSLEQESMQLLAQKEMPWYKKLFGFINKK